MLHHAARITLAVGLAITIMPTAGAAAAPGGLTVVVSPATSAVGQPISVTATLQSPPSAGGTFTFTANSQPFGSVTTGPGVTTVTYAFAATSPGTTTVAVSYVSGTESPREGAAALQAVPAPTSTSVTAATPVAPGSRALIEATVSGGGIPTGTVTFSINGAPIGTSVLTSGTARVTYLVPTGTLGPAYAAASYSGDAGHLPSTGSDATDVQKGTRMSLLAPGTVTAGKPVVLTAVAPGLTGTIVFLLDGRALALPVEVKAGKTSIPWTPTGAGTVKIAGKFTGTEGTFEAVDKLDITVSSYPDFITGTLDGVPWGSVETLRNGKPARVAFTALSRAVVTGHAAGPCTLSAAGILTATSGTGTCTVSATAGPSGQWPAAANILTIPVAPGTQAVAWLADGTVKRGTPVRLFATEATIAGHPGTAKVTTGKTRCQIARTPDGIMLTGSKRGVCLVRFTSPAVAGDWLAYDEIRAFKIR